jgi:hypothetical protein
VRTKNLVGTIFCSLGAIAGYIGMTRDSGLFWFLAIILVVIGVVAFCWRSNVTTLDVVDSAVDIANFLD